MTVHRCPNCTGMNDRTNCSTCMGTAYVHRRSSDGRITHPASPKEALDDMRRGKPGPRPSPQGYRRRR